MKADILMFWHPKKLFKVKVNTFELVEDGFTCLEATLPYETSIEAASDEKEKVQKFENIQSQVEIPNSLDAEEFPTDEKTGKNLEIFR